MSAHIAQLRRRAGALADELASIREEIQRVEEEGFVGVQFPGNSTIYTYEMAPGHGASVGEYVMVHSPRTGRDEIVKVVRTGRGSWRYTTKVARAIVWGVWGVDDLPRRG